MLELPVYKGLTDKYNLPVSTLKIRCTYEFFNIGLDKQFFLSVKMLIFSAYPPVLTYVLGTHNICFGWEIRKLFSWYALLTEEYEFRVFGRVRLFQYMYLGACRFAISLP